MKKIILSTFVLFLLIAPAFSSFNYSQTDVLQKHVVVMVGTASWCPICQTHGKRVKAEVVKQFENDSAYTIVMNDLSNDSSRAVSLANTKAAGIDGFAKKHKSTGVIYFINSETKKMISKISVTESNEKIKQAFIDALIANN